MNNDTPDVIPFAFDGHDVRAIRRDSQAWLVAKDVCDALSISNSRDAVSRLDDDEKNTVAITDGTPGNPNKTVINEAGCYRLVFTSRKESAERFKRWLAHDVLPEIRQTGSYNGTGRRDEGEGSSMTPIEALAETTQHLAEMERRQQELDGRLSDLEERRREADRQLRRLPDAKTTAPEKDDRSRLNEIVRAYAQSTGTFPQHAWRTLYKEINYRLHVNVHQRAENRGIRKIQVLEDDGLLRKAYAVARKVFGHALGDRFTA
jgi:prophage antirepressor-like protein